MRADTAAFIEGLHRKDQEELRGLRSGELARVEALADGSAIVAVIGCGLDRGGIRFHRGVLGVCTLGLLWAGQGADDLFWPWEDLRSVDPGRGYVLGAVTMGGEPLKSIDDNRKASREHFWAAARPAIRDHMP
jgi:hypothetical protein